MKTLLTLLLIGTASAFGQSRPLYVPNTTNTPSAGDFVVFNAANWVTFATKDGSSLVNLQSTSITNTAATLAPTSNQTNYTITLYPNGAKYFLYSANTNVNITFASVAAGSGASIFISAVTSSANCAITLPTSLLTNINYHSTVTNGTGEWFNYESTDGTSTNITVMAGGFHRR